MSSHEQNSAPDRAEMIMSVKDGLFKVAFRPPLKGGKISKGTSTGIVRLHMDGRHLKSVDYFAGLYGNTVESAVENFQSEQSYRAGRVNRELVNELPEQPRLHLSPEFMQQLLRIES